MSIKTEFQSQWGNVITAIKVELNKQFDYFGKINLDKLNETYGLQKQKWSSSLMYEGNWLSSKEDDFSRDFLRALGEFKFTEVNLPVKTSPVGYLVSAGIGVGSFVVIKYVLHFAFLNSLAIAGVILLLGFFFCSSSARGKKKAQTEEIKAAYVEQLKKTEDRLAAICEKYDR